jgi:transposase
VDFCQEDGVSRIAGGDVRDLQTGVRLGRVTNQKISQWPHGQFARYLTEKAARLGSAVEWLDEAYSTRTCSPCSHRGHVQPSSPRGRRFRCAGCGAQAVARGLWRAGCGAQVHRAVNGSATICSQAVFGRYSKIQADTVKYLRPIGVAPWTRATRSWR